ncbi:ABC transporter permease [Actinoplanes oblitus]|uniref:ABC transporter permease n=1 Tax=Actinoplanes oblitus TaxID=3040509 RepID=A0ABY8WMK6_9ACTN|nr:FtsX-like permease family protein [Actinoplanes oblitus]WIM98873.1 ABC transporter permease [Actinoplanes oblitus]
MFTILWAAVRSRAAQTFTLLVLTALPAAAAAAAPWYALSTAGRDAAATTATVPAAERTVIVHWDSDTGVDPEAALDAFGDKVAQTLPMPGADGALGLSRAMTVVDPGGAADHINVDYLAGFCDRVRLTGDCPARAGDAAITKAVAERLGVRPGATLVVRGSVDAEARRIPMRVTALYEITDPAAGHWADSLFKVDSGLDPIFTVPRTFTGSPLSEPVFTWSAEVPVPLLRGDDGYDLGELVAQSGAIGKVTDPTGPLRAELANAGVRLLRAVLLAALPVLLLGWYAIALAGRYTARDRRRDAALLKMRGGSRKRLLLLLSGQHVAPLLAGGLVGTAAGIAAGRILAGGGSPAAAGWSLAAVAGVLLGAFVILVVADLLLIRTPVAVLQRELPAARAGRAALLADVLLIALAVAAAYQARSGSPDTGVGAIAPLAVSVAAVVLLARLLIRAADRGGGAALRAGQLRFGLTAVRMSRLAGLDRVFALLAVAVAMLVTATGAAAADRAAHTARAEAELGADRVLTVRAANWTALRHAVAVADPDGRYAMAAAVDARSSPPVLAVDTGRLAAAGAWRAEFGPLPALADEPDPVPPITGHALVLRVRNDRAAPADVDAVLQNETTGAKVSVSFGPVPPGEHTVTAELTGCAEGCRLARWELPARLGPDGVPVPQPVTLHSLAQRGPDAGLLGADLLADATRWRTGSNDVGLSLAGGPDGLTVAAGAGAAKPGADRVFPVDTPLPLPLLQAGPVPVPWRLGEPTLNVSGALVPARVTATVPALPVLGASGVLADFDALRRVAAEAGAPGVTQVWLTADAPAAVVDRLKEAGVLVLTDETAAARAGRTAGRGTAPAGSFALLCAVLAVLTAAAVGAVAASVDRGPQRASTTALRVQGLPAATAAASRYLGPFVLVVGGVAGGVLAAVLARRLTGEPGSYFEDGWRLLPPPEVLGWPPLLVSALLTMLFLTGLAAVSAMAAGEGGPK